MGENAAFEKRLELVFDKLGDTRSGVCFDLGEKRLRLVSDYLIERRFPQTGARDVSV